MPEGLFPTPSGVRQRMADERLQRANMIGQLGPAGHGALGGLLTGQAIGGLLGAPQDPRLAKAARFQQVEQEMAQLGLEPGSKEFTRQIYQRMLPVGQQEALQAYQMALEMEGQRLEIDKLTAGPANIYRALLAAGYPPELAAALSQVPESGKKALTAKVTPEQADQIIGRARYAATGPDGTVDEAKARRLVAKDFEKASGVTISIGDKERDKFIAQRRYLDEVAEDKRTAYEKAVNAYRQDPTSMAKKRAADNAAEAYRTAIAGAENFRGEPSGEVARRFEVPGAIRSAVEGVVEDIFKPGEKPVSEMTDEELEELAR